MSHIFLARTPEQIRRCHPVMAELRPHLNEADFLAQVLRQQTAFGYQLAALEVENRVIAAAGYRITEFLAWGKTLYVDDLVTSEKHRSHGNGQKLFAWLIACAREQGCDQFHLDSGVHRFGAHRFYLGQRMDISAHHFALKLKPAAA